MPNSALIPVLARSLASGSCTFEDAYLRAARTLGRNWRWLRPVVRRYVERFRDSVRPRHRDLIAFLKADEDLRAALATYGDRIRIAEWIAEPQVMRPVPAAAGWGVPPIESAGDLAEWLGLTLPQLEWFADLKGLGYRYCNPKLRHYCYRICTKRSGGVRLIESPKPVLKKLQRQILTEILDRVPVHPACHAFAKGRSIVSFARPHANRRVVLRLDLQDFFPGFPAARVQAVFRTMGYPDTDEQFSRVVERFPVYAAAVAREEGFRVNHRKTRIMRQGVRQHLAGLVVNDKPAVPRRDLQLLEAILTNCVRHGPASQNRENVPDFHAHLEGRIGFVAMVNREKAERLRMLFNAIQWS